MDKNCVNQMEEKRCRTCNELSKNLNDLQDLADWTTNNSYADLLLDIAKIDITLSTSPELPKHLCGSCCRKLKNAHSFVLQARRVNEELLACALEGKLVNQKQHGDCLLETPIDVDSFLQIKVEPGIEEKDLYNEVNTTLNSSFGDYPQLDTTRKRKSSEGSFLPQPGTSFASCDGLESKESEASSDEDDTKLDPITVAEAHWDTDKEETELADKRDNDKTKTLSCEKPSDSDEDYKPMQKNKRGRPSVYKNTEPQANGRFSCEVCQKTFAWKKDLHRHRNGHFETFKYECTLCERKFLRKDKLKDHLKTHVKQGNEIEITDKNVIKPKLCNMRPSEWNFIDCLYTRTPPGHIQCKLCAVEFLKIRDLRDHFVMHLDNSKSYENLDLTSNFVKSVFPLATLREEVIENILKDIRENHLTKYCDIVNEYGYEMSLSDSDGDLATESANEMEHLVGMYKCEICAETFNRKFQIFLHARNQHANEQLPYKCAVCKVEFVCERVFNMHTRSQCRNREKKYQCSKCPGKFMWIENLEVHKCANRFNITQQNDKVVPKRDNYKCTKCNQTFVHLRGLKRHMETHKNISDGYECSMCNQKFMKFDNLRLHMHKSHEQAELPRIKCCLCKQILPKLANLRLHLEEHLSLNFSNINTSEGQFFKVYYPNGCMGNEEEVVREIVEDFSLKRKMSRYFSAVDESGTELELNDSESESDNEGNSSKKEDSKNKHKCDLCLQDFSRRKHLLHHQFKVHQSDGSLPHRCHVCSSEFVALSLLQQHFQRVCFNEDKKFHCSKCQARFMWQENLMLHTQIKHVETQQANKLQCDKCDKVFVWAKDLTRHRRVHLPDEEKYTCSFCERKFNRKDNMQNHVQKVHGAMALASVCRKDSLNQLNKIIKIKEVDRNLCKPNGCKQIQCMICHSKHSKISDLRTHLRTHQYVVSFVQRQDSLVDISLQLYPTEAVMTESQLTERIVSDIIAQRYDNFYSITNEVGYELNLDSSETDTDSEPEGDGMSNNVNDTSKHHVYTCDICSAKFKRKYQVFDHHLLHHKWEDAAHVCVYCDARFLSQELLLIHLDRQCKNLKKRFICRKCPLRFMWKDNYKVHLRTIHAEGEEINKIPAVPQKIECVQCDRQFRMQKDLTRHMIMHRTDTSLIKCLWCSRKFYRQENYLMHLRRHGISPENLATAEMIVTSTTTANGTKKIICKVCNIELPNMATLKQHIQQEVSNPNNFLLNSHLHHDFNSPMSYSITNKLGFELHINDSETEEEDASNKTENGVSIAKRHCMSKQYTCLLCNLGCKRKYEIALHQRSIHRFEQVPLKCDKCVFKTVSKDIFEHHKRTQCYNLEKQFQCKKCKFKYMWQENLEAHENLFHPNIKTEEIPENSGITAETSTSNTKARARSSTNADQTFQCEQCTRKYNRKDRLAAHIKKMHSNKDNNNLSKTNESEIDPVTGEVLKKVVAPEKKFLCAFCGRAVTSSSNLIIHMRRHTGEKPFKCDFCDMAFPRSSDLQCHRRKHTGEKPHQCTVCQKAFSRSYKLQTHMRIHSGERPYKCTYCEKSFTQSNDLTLHVRRHTGERPYVCGICGERFIQGTALKNHRTMRGHFEEVEPRRTSILEQF